MYCKRLTFFVFNLTSYIIAIKKSKSQIFRTIYIGGQQYVFGHKLVGARKNYFKICGAVKKRSQLESCLFSIFFQNFNNATLVLAACDRFLILGRTEDKCTRNSPST